MERAARGVHALWAGLILAGCTGAIGSGDAPGESPRAPPDPAGPRPGVPGGAVPGAEAAAAPARAACPADAPRGAARAGVRRLTREELRTSLADLLPVPGLPNEEIDLFPDVTGREDFTRFTPHHSDSQVSQWLAIADRVGSIVAADPRARSAVGADPCLGASAVSSACWHSVVRPFLRRAFRRPAADEEVSRYAAPLVGKDAATGIQALVLRVLLSPDFLFHLERGATAEGGRVRLVDHEVASRISYALTGSMPDAALAAAAEGGQLGTLEQLEGQARRLLETPRARQQVQRFFGAWMDVESIAPPDPQLYSSWARLPGDPAQVARELERDVSDFVEAVVLKDKGGFREVMTRRASYTRSAALQAIYAAQAPGAAGAAYATPDHAGLPLRAGLLTDPGLNTHPITRGVRFLKRLLCDELPSPDPAVIAMRDDVKIDPLSMPNHQRVAAMTGAPACQPCHVKINPIGFLLESYDPVARRRTRESYLEPAPAGPKVSATHPLPGPIELAMEGLPPRLAGPDELMEGLAGSPQARACMATHLLRQQQRRPQAPADGCAIAEVAGVLADGRPALEAFVRSVVNEDIFWRGL